MNNNKYAPMMEKKKEMIEMRNSFLLWSGWLILVFALLYMLSLLQ